MKGEIKIKYQEFVNHTDFPVILYVYETNKVLAMNTYARTIIGEDIEDIKTLYSGKKFRLPKDVLNGGSKLILNVKITTSDSLEKYIDMDVNVLAIDNVHFVFMLFDESIKNKFTSYMNVEIPRVSWKYNNSEDIHMNYILLNDISSMIIAEKKINDKLDFLETVTIEKINEGNTRIISEGESQYNSIQMIGTKRGDNHFIKVSRMPIISNGGEIIGVLCFHYKILNKDEHRKLYDTALQNNNFVNEIINKSDTVFISWKNDKKSTIQYISPNIVKYGYEVNRFISGEIKFKDIVYKDDYSIIKTKFNVQELKDKEPKTAVYEYRIVRSDGEVVWVHEECIPIILNDNIMYYFSSLQDITNRKLNEKIEEKVCKETIGFDKKDVLIQDNYNFEDIFEYEEIFGLQKLLGDNINMVSFVTDLSGNIITYPVTSLPINDDISKLLNMKKSKKMYEELGRQSFEQNEVVMEDFYNKSIKVAAIPFQLGHIHIASFIIIAVVDNIGLELSEKNKEKYKKFIVQYKRNNRKCLKEFEQVLTFVSEHIVHLCTEEEYFLRKQKIKSTFASRINEESIYKKMIDGMKCEVILFSGENKVIRYVNDIVKKRFEGELLGKDIFEFLINYAIENNEKSQEKNIYKIINECIVKKKRFTTYVYDGFNNRYLVADVMYVEDNNIKDAVMIMFKEVDKFKEEIKQDRYYDYVSGLQNRIKYEIDAKNYIINSIKNQKNGTLLMFEIANFKRIKYDMGNVYAEKLIKEYVQCIKSNELLNNCTYRCRGVEFLVLVDTDEQSYLNQIINILNETFNKKMILDGKKIEISINIGITKFPQDGINPKELLKNVDYALYEAKKKLNSNVAYYKVND